MAPKSRYIRFFDWKIFCAILTLCLLGLVAIYSAGQFSELRNQVYFITTGLVVFFVMSLINYEDLKKTSEIFYGFMLLLLFLVMNIGHEAYGAQRWLTIAGFTFQPSEIAKLIVIIAVAKFLENYQDKLTSLLKSLPSFLLIGLPFFLIFKQPDLSTSMVLIIIFVVMLLWAGMAVETLLLLASPLISIMCLHLIPLYPFWTWSIYLLLLLFFLLGRRLAIGDTIIFFSLNVLAGLFSPLLWNSLAAYQQKRILSFLNPSLDPLARGIRYHMTKSMIAVGSGGFFGQGFNRGPLTRLGYIPHQHTDFVFSIIAEEFGLLGSLLVIGLFLYIIYRLISLALETKSDFGSLIVIGIAAMLLFQVFVNIGMNIGIMPVMGIPLPFVSYGGSSLVMYFAAFGIIQSIIMRRRHLMF